MAEVHERTRLIGMHFAHQLKRALSQRSRVLLWVLLPTLSVLEGCVSNAALVPATSPSCAAVEETIRWLRIPPGDEQRRSDQWCAGVGPPVVVRGSSTEQRNRLVIVSWNVHVGGGNIGALVQDLRKGRLTAGVPIQSFVLLLQEVYRSGKDVPSSPPAEARFAGAVRAGGPERADITATARALGLSLFYVPSMRNGAPTATNEDRGSAILSTLPLDDYTAIELPLEHQRRIAVAASLSEAGGGSTSPLRVVSAHFTNAVGHHLWIASEPARLRQARALAAALDAGAPTILGGDFNTWFGYHDAAYKELARRFPNPRPADRRATFSIMRLDHVFYRLPDRWLATVHRGESRYGSDHFPLIAELTRP